ncbi:tetratricopeptide repeat protein [Acanthopleuribacter pedis]|uniref:Uncharacterized protein n=1 Tax=Acanthopleuribacter pedis TaxID=442870 RepID=A0A8J7PZY6_9BACT|nr:hypothetical protein [Acanthopleuribacter pedis]MBO1316839.1 hypothetical protein [Acanthopleuribacter pedis]
MFVFPSSESATPIKSPPWFSIVWILATLGFFFLSVLPAEQRYRTHRADSLQRIEQALEAQLQGGNLKQGIYVQAVTNPNLIELPEFNHVFDDQVKAAYAEFKLLRHPFLERAAAMPDQRLLLLLQPHHAFIMLLGLVCLIATGFVFEHLFDSLWIASCLLLNAAALFTLDLYVGNQWTPSLVYAWFWLSLIMMVIPCILKPRTDITFTLRLWLGNTKDFDLKLELWLFPLMFLGGGSAITWYLTDFPVRTASSALPVTAALALVSALLMTRIPTREQKLNRNPEVFGNQELARAEGLFEQEKPKEALEAMRELLQLDLENAQLMRIAHLAFQNEDIDLASLAYQAVLRRHLREGKSHDSVHLVLEMLERNLRVPGATIERTLDAAYTMGSQATVIKILPHLQDHPDVLPETVHRQYNRHIDAVLAQSKPDRNYLHELQRSLEFSFPGDPMSMRINQFLHATAPSLDPEPVTTPSYHIQKFVAVEIIRVQGNDITVELGGKYQKLPWTAILALYGCHVLGGDRGYHGFVVTRNKSKIFCCSFKATSLEKYEGPSATFENVWKDLLKQAPEDLPRVTLSDFENHMDSKDLEEKVQDFLNRVPA